MDHVIAGSPWPVTKPLSEPDSCWVFRVWSIRSQFDVVQVWRFGAKQQGWMSALAGDSGGARGGSKKGRVFTSEMCESCGIQPGLCSLSRAQVCVYVCARTHTHACGHANANACAHARRLCCAFVQDFPNQVHARYQYIISARLPMHYSCSLMDVVHRMHARVQGMKLGSEGAGEREIVHWNAFLAPEPSLFFFLASVTPTSTVHTRTRARTHTQAHVILQLH